jgi:hypothetical protein
MIGGYRNSKSSACRAEENARVSKMRCNKGSRGRWVPERGCSSMSSISDRPGGEVGAGMRVSYAVDINARLAVEPPLNGLAFAFVPSPTSGFPSPPSPSV